MIYNYLFEYMSRENISDSQEDCKNENENDQNYHFFKEYCRLYYANIILTNRLQQLLNEKQQLSYKLTKLDVSIFKILTYFFIEKQTKT